MYALIACGVFEKEIERIKETLGFPLETFYLEAGLHVDFDDLGAALKAQLEECRDYQGIIVAYGACHPKIEEIISPYNATLLKAQNCIDAFITRKKVEEIARRGLYFYLSPGWLDCWQDMFARLAWDQTEARYQLGSFKGTIFIDTLNNSGDYEWDLIEFLDFTLLKYEIIPAALDHFKSLIIDAKERLED